MSIQTSSEDLEQIRERLRKMSDSDLLRYGQTSRHMADPKNNQGNLNPAVQVQLDEARAEWRRRHPKLPLSESLWPSAKWIRAVSFGSASLLPILVCWSDPLQGIRTFLCDLRALQ